MTNGNDLCPCLGIKTLPLVYPEGNAQQIMDTENEHRKVRVISDELLSKEKKIIRRYIYIYMAGGGDERLREFVMELIPILNHWRSFREGLNGVLCYEVLFFLWTFFLPDND